MNEMTGKESDVQKKNENVLSNISERRPCFSYGNELFMLQAWTDFFDGSPTDKRPNSKARIEVTSGTVHVFAASFESIEHLNGSGGAASFSSSSDSSILLVEASSFFHCKSSSSGGGIFFSNKGNSIISKVCSYGCFSTTRDGQFCYVEITKQKKLSKRSELLNYFQLCCEQQFSCNV